MPSTFANATVSTDMDTTMILPMTYSSKEPSIGKDPTTRSARVNEVHTKAPREKNQSLIDNPPKRQLIKRWMGILGITALIGIGLGIYFIVQSKQQKVELIWNSTPITVYELSLHNDSVNDCWILVRGGVYDVTDFAPAHPGGPEIVTNFCGANATKEFSIRHPTQHLSDYLPYDAMMGQISLISNTTTATSAMDDAVNTTTNTTIDDTDA